MTNLTQKFEYEVRGKKYVAYPLSLDQTEEIEVQLASLEKVKDNNKKIKECYVDVIYMILKDYNEGITKDEIAKTFPLSGILLILNQTIISKKEIEELVK